MQNRVFGATLGGPRTTPVIGLLLVVFSKLLNYKGFTYPFCHDLSENGYLNQNRQITAVLLLEVAKWSARILRKEWPEFLNNWEEDPS